MSEPAAPLRVRMIRCSTVLLEWGTLRLLTDPWFGMHLRGLPCLRRPGMRPREMPPLDAVLVSHLHGDHFDRRALRRFPVPPARVLLPPGARAALGGFDGPGWSELAPWTGEALGAIRVDAVPGPHTGPGPAEINFVIQLPGWGSVFFGGDARYDEAVMSEIARRHAPVRLALLPVGGSLILGRRTVMGPRDAERAADRLQASYVVPIHEGGIWLSVPPLSLHPGRATHLQRAFARRGEPGRVLVLREGASVELPAG